MLQSLSSMVNSIHGRHICQQCLKSIQNILSETESKNKQVIISHALLQECNGLGLGISGSLFLTWAVQMLLVALSRRMCCSRVCRASLSASLLFASLQQKHKKNWHHQFYTAFLATDVLFFFQMIIRLHSLLKRKICFNCIFKYFFSYLVTPIILPGINLRNSFLVEKNPAWGPPYPMGIPNRWLDPTAMSTPNSPGGRNMVSAKRSVAQVTRVWKKYMMLCCATPHKRTENHCVRSGFTKGY